MEAPTLDAADKVHRGFRSSPRPRSEGPNPCWFPAPMLMTPTWGRGPSSVFHVHRVYEAELHQHFWGGIRVLAPMSSSMSSWWCWESQCPAPPAGPLDPFDSSVAPTTRAPVLPVVIAARRRRLRPASRFSPTRWRNQRSFENSWWPCTLPASPCSLRRPGAAAQGYLTPLRQPCSSVSSPQITTAPMPYSPRP